MVWSLLLVTACNSYAQHTSETSLPQGFHKLPSEVQTALLQDSNSIVDVQAEIWQTIRQHGREEARHGYYWADNRGRFRLQFFEPNELVVFDGEKLYWYIPSNGFSWVIAADHALKPQTLGKPHWLSQDFWLEYQEPLWQKFFPSDKISFKVHHREMSVTIHYSRSLKAIVLRQLYDAQGNWLLREEFSDPVACAGKPFFRRVKVIAGQGSLKVHNDTQYRYPLCNRGLVEALFMPPPGPKKIYRP